MAVATYLLRVLPNQSVFFPHLIQDPSQIALELQKLATTHARETNFDTRGDLLLILCILKILKAQIYKDCMQQIPIIFLQ